MHNVIERGGNSFRETRKRETHISCVGRGEDSALEVGQGGIHSPGVGCSRAHSLRVRQGKARTCGLDKVVLSSLIIG